MTFRTGRSCGAKRAALLAFAGAGALAGCSNPVGHQALNTADDLGPYVPLDGLQGAPARAAEMEGGTNAESTLLTMDRSNWVSTTVYVPISGVEHQPHYTGLYPLLSTETARQRGEFPTADNSMETTTDHSTQRQFGDGIAAPVYGALDILLFIPRTFCAPIMSVVESPMDGYQRSPSVVPILAPPPAPPKQPAAVPLGVPDIPYQPPPDDSRTKKP
jgi:hypothetical protein